MLTFVSNASITLRKRHMLDMLSYDRQGGWGGWGGMLTFVSSASITLRKRHMLDMLSYDREGGGGVGGVGGDVNVRVERFHHVTEEAHVAYVVV